VELLLINPVILITDLLLFLLLAMVIGYAMYARKHEHLYAPWLRLGKSKVAMGSSAILLAYLSVGVLDSIHFQLPTEDYTSEKPRYQTETLSALDIALTGLREKSEKTYSAPFASYSFTKETIEHDNGTTTRDYTPLRFAGTHLIDGESILVDTIVRVTTGVIKGLLLGATLLLILALRTRKKYALSLIGSLYAILQGRMNNHRATQWQIFLFVSTGLFISIAIIAELSHVYHVFGTDKIGDSVLYQSLKSIRTGIMIGTLTTLVMLPFAIALGIAAGYFRGWIDDLIQYLYTTLNSIPSVLLIASAILMLQVHLDNHASDYDNLLERADLRLLFLCMILGVTSWTGLCRYLRAESLKLREMDYIAAARTMGVGHGTILMQHILPNVMHLVLITVVLDFSGLVLAEAVLAYVDIGVDPTTGT